MSDAHWFGAKGPRSRGQGHPIMFGKPKPAEPFEPFPDGGGYPKGFVEWALADLGCTDPDAVLHICSGSMHQGIRVDIREGLPVSVVADARRLPFGDNSFRWIMADPPYAESYAENLYGTGVVYPKPGQLLREAARVCVPGGRIGILHHLVPMVRRPLYLCRVSGVTTGAGYAIRAWSVFRKAEAWEAGASEAKNQSQPEREEG